MKKIQDIINVSITFILLAFILISLSRLGFFLWQTYGPSGV